MLNFSIEPRVLEPLVPAGTMLDRFDGTVYASLIAFDFLDTRVKGVAIPFHRSFEEINLRFYVRREVAGEVRRGVVFVREVVPRRAIAWLARALYNENYVARRTRRSFTPRPDGGGSIGFEWRDRGDWLHLGAEYCGDPSLPLPGSEEEFITEHYWGYSTQRDGGTVEYRVEHPQWRVWRASSWSMDGDFRRFYGDVYGPALERPPTSVFVAEGSAVKVRQGEKLAPFSG